MTDNFKLANKELAIYETMRDEYEKLENPYIKKDEIINYIKN